MLFDRLESFTVVEFVEQTAEFGNVKFVVKQFEGKFKVKSIGKVMVIYPKFVIELRNWMVKV